jgi:hypothetical protein
MSKNRVNSYLRERTCDIPLVCSGYCGDDGKTAGIYLFLPGFREGDADLKQIGYLLLDDVLGEYDVESRLGLIKMLSPDSLTDGERYPLAELAARFDVLVSRLEGDSQKPS